MYSRHLLILLDIFQGVSDNFVQGLIYADVIETSVEILSCLSNPDTIVLKKTQVHFTHAAYIQAHLLMDDDVESNSTHSTVVL